MQPSGKYVTLFPVNSFLNALLAHGFLCRLGMLCKEVDSMRLDKYLKVSRIIKRRTVANEACAGGRVSLNGKVAKPGAEVKVGDEMTIRFGDKLGRYQILSINETVRKGDAAEMYRILSEDAGMAAERN